jgi:hypothetical protein
VEGQIRFYSLILMKFSEYNHQIILNLVIRQILGYSRTALKKSSI